MPTPPATAVVTGASTGIGEACALRLARGGWRVFAGVRKKDDANRLREHGLDGLEPIELDVTDAQQIESARERVERAVGAEGLGGVVNNAGIAVGGPQEYLDVAEFRRQFEVNVFGAIAVTHAFMPALRRGTGRIVNIGSLGGRVANPFMAPYSASKFALEAITDALRIELRPWGLHASIIEPGAVRTPIWDKGDQTIERVTSGLPPEAREHYGFAFSTIEKFARDARRRGVSPDRVARAAEHALTARRPRPRYIVGADARLGIFARWLLPDRMMDWMIARMFGIR
jgi:NAD(P)-dependent dehydrogenase (short-subunit alcohol dehydrogenase family)